ncbi:Cystatin [Aphelenchoides fujianensis]|nr:Cystatin [Aphelenchoides fujianensis]
MPRISIRFLAAFLLVSAASVVVIMATEEGHKGRQMGGWTQQDVESDKIKEFANKAVNKLNQQSNDMHQHIVTKILSAESQVVAGAKYRIKAEFGRTSCKKASSSARFLVLTLGEVCGENEPVQSTKTYNIEIFSQPWTNTEEIKFTEA